MNYKNLVMPFTFLFLSISSTAHAGVEVWAIVDNQTSSSVSLVGSGTLGAFSIAPPSLVDANSQAGVATFTQGAFERGFLHYGSCIFFWNISVLYFLDASTRAEGAGCSAAIVTEIPTGPNSAFVLIELEIT